MSSEVAQAGAFACAVAVAPLMFIQAMTGLLFRSKYCDNDFCKHAWYGNDVITLLAATPLLIWSLCADEALIWLGVLAFSAYNYDYNLPQSYDKKRKTFYFHKILI